MASQHDRQPHKSSFRRIIKKHSMLITLSGALIVFSTFVVNDILRDSERHVVDALTAGRTEYLIREQHREVISRLASIEKDLDEVGQEKPHHLESLIAPERQTLEEISRKNSDADSELNSIFMLLDAMPDKQSYEEQLDGLRGQVSDAFTAEGELEDGLDKVTATRDAVPRTTDEAQFTEKLEELDPKIDALEEQQFSINNRIDDFHSVAIDAAFNAKDREERKSVRYTRVSYFLYAIGWCLGILGRLGGAD
jgi:hypothetical protein